MTILFKIKMNKTKAPLILFLTQFQILKTKTKSSSKILLDRKIKKIIIFLFIKKFLNLFKHFLTIIFNLFFQIILGKKVATMVILTQIQVTMIKRKFLIENK